MGLGVDGRVGQAWRACLRDRSTQRSINPPAGVPAASRSAASAQAKVEIQAAGRVRMSLHSPGHTPLMPSEALVAALKRPKEAVPAAIALLNRGWGLPLRTIETSNSNADAASVGCDRDFAADVS